MAKRRDLIKTTAHGKYLDSARGRVYRTGKRTVQATTDETYAQGQARRAANRKAAGFPGKAKSRGSAAQSPASKAGRATAARQSGDDYWGRLSRKKK